MEKVGRSVDARSKCAIITPFQMAWSFAVESTEQFLKGAGIVTTRQRVALLRLINNRKDHPDVEGMFITAREHLPSISVDTVYRTLNLFAEAGVIQRMAVPTRRARFDGNALPHDHFLCEKCERIFDIPTEVNRLRAPLEVKAFGKVRAAQTVYIGVCAACIESAR